jgi:hypothetical protein
MSPSDQRHAAIGGVVLDERSFVRAHAGGGRVVEPGQVELVGENNFQLAASDCRSSARDRARVGALDGSGPRLDSAGQAGRGCLRTLGFAVSVMPNRRAYCPGYGAVQASSQRDPPMSDKSPRQTMSKKSGKSIKEQRAEKRSKGTEETFSEKIHPTKKK